MNINCIPLLYFLPTVIMIDDNRAFLDNFSMEIAYSGLVETYTNPKEAIKEILSRNNLFKKRDEFINSIKLEYVDSDDDCCAINYENILATAFREKRFYEPAIVIVDYSMPEMDGVEFCRKLQNFSCLKIMLTAEADHKVAVNAFNDGVINKFILKDVESSKNEIKLAIDESIKRYFIDFSNSINSIKCDIKSDGNYVSIFNDWLKKYEIVEYYACADNGSNLGIDNNGEMRWFVINSEKDINDYVNIARDHGASHTVIDAMQSRKYQLCLITESQKKESVKNWEKYLFQVSGEFPYKNDTLYFSFTENLKPSEFKRKIITVGDIKEQRQKANFL